MSFILDALRKSEQERQRNQRPGVVNVRVQDKPRQQTYWLPLVMLLVGVNLSLLFFLWVKGSPSEATVAAPPAPIPSAPAVTAPPVYVPPVSDSRDLAAELSPADLAAPPPPPATQIPTDDPVAVEQPESPPPKPAIAPGGSSAGRIPTLTELLLSGTLDLKPLHLDIHVYSEIPAERFVFINMSKYREGDTLEEGPAVESITAEGVVLSHQGSNFIITREQ